MKPALIVLAALPLTLAHTTITQFFINGVSEGDGYVCLRPPPVGQTTWPVQDLTSPDMACGLSGTIGVSRACSVPDGATLTFQYRMEPDNPSAGPIASSHVGSCAVYLKNVQDAVMDGAAGDGWFKIWDQSYDGTNFCTTNLINGDGYMTVTIPKGLKGGYYLVRTELLAIHIANQGDPQYYVECAQIYLDSTGDLVPRDTDTVGIPGYVDYTDSSDSFNVYDGAPFTAFRPPGPSPASLVSGGNTYGNVMKDGAASQDCILEVGNWCAVEVPNYTDQTSCWASVNNCWAQDTQCWAQPYSSLTDACTIWQNKCTSMNSQCTNANPQGPPNKDLVLTPQPQTLDPIPPPLGPTRGLIGGENPTDTPTSPSSTASTRTTRSLVPTSPPIHKHTIITTITTSVYTTVSEPEPALVGAAYTSPTTIRHPPTAALSIAPVKVYGSGEWLERQGHNRPSRRRKVSSSKRAEKLARVFWA